MARTNYDYRLKERSLKNNFRDKRDEFVYNSLLQPKDESKNKIYLYEDESYYEDREEQEPPINIQLQEDETMEETTDIEEDNSGWTIGLILGVILIFILVMYVIVI